MGWDDSLAWSNLAHELAWHSNCTDYGSCEQTQFNVDAVPYVPDHVYDRSVLLAFRHCVTSSSGSLALAATHDLPCEAGDNCVDPKLVRSTAVDFPRLPQDSWDSIYAKSRAEEYAPPEFDQEQQPTQQPSDGDVEGEDGCPEVSANQMCAITPSEAEDVGSQADGEWVMHEPKIPPSAYFLYVSGERERMRKTLCKPNALELQSGWSKMDPETKAEFETRASQLLEQYRVQLREYRQSGQFRSVPSCSSGHVNWTMPETEPVQNSDGEMLEISVGQLEAFMDTFAIKAVASCDMDPSYCQQMVDKLKVAFQRPDKEAASFTKEQFQLIIEKLGEKFASTVPKESLVKASQSSQQP